MSDFVKEQLIEWGLSFLLLLGILKVAYEIATSVWK